MSVVAHGVSGEVRQDPILSNPSLRTVPVESFFTCTSTGRSQIEFLNVQNPQRSRTPIGFDDDGTVPARVNK
jgi:hypothetical protein